ncbi:carboxymuconolactone decarboxylase family protein [Litorivivens sp.]|uniref:carboxymuconolactone decarboxylase family protein n=2 Tax=Litorivivens sp. TaxID=2020868 RepID=UPI00356538FD
MTKSRVSLPANAGDDPISGSALALQPEALAAFNQLYGTLWSRGVLDHPSKELARLRNARKTNCVFCKNVRFSQAKAEGLDETQVEQIRDGYEDSDLSSRQKLILSYTDTFLIAPNEIDDALQNAMKGEFSDEEIVELTAALALFMGFSKIAVSLGGMPDSLPTFEMPTPD